MSTLAVVLVVTGGTAYAAKTVIDGRSIKPGTVKTKQLGANAVTSAKVKDRSLLARDFARGQLPAGAQGPVGPAGAQGPIGVTGPSGERGAQGATGEVDTSSFYDKAASDARYATPTARTIVVSASGTPLENGAALNDAVQVTRLDAPSNIADAVLIRLGPGEFDLSAIGPVATPGHVTFEGAGRGATVVRGVGTVFSGAPAEIRDLQISTSGSGGANATAVATTAPTALLSRLRITVSAPGARAMGVRMNDNVSMTMRDVEIVASGERAIGIGPPDGAGGGRKLDAHDVRVRVTGTDPGGGSYALRGDYIDATVRESNFGATTPDNVAVRISNSGVMLLGDTVVQGNILVENLALLSCVGVLDQNWGPATC